MSPEFTPGTVVGAAGFDPATPCAQGRRRERETASASSGRWNQRCGVGALLRSELLRPPDVHVGGVEAPLAVDMELVHPPEPAGERAERAARVEQLAGQVVLQHLLRDAV